MDLFSVMFSIAFFLVFGIIIFSYIKGISQWNKNNNSPRLTVNAVVMTKRSSYHHYTAGTENIHTHSTTYYYVTFQVESGDRMELNMSGAEYGMLAEGDRGKLTFQGTRYLSFERI